jgi:hypothetical protein
VGTDKLCESIGDKQAAKNDCLDFGVMLWAEQFKGIDGAWWDDDYAPGRLSLPRGGIFPEKLGEWIASSEQENIKKLKRSWLSVDTQLIDK